jgi:periplasmic protein TonB
MSESAASSTSRRNVAIAAGVVLFHIGALWALQTGLLRRAVEVIVPVQVFSEIITPPAPRIEPPQPQPQVKPRDPVPRPVAPRQPVAPPPAPKLQAAPDLPPAANAPVATLEPQPAPPPVSAPVAVAPAPAAPPPRVELPSSSADYLQNPKPAYPPASKRLGEQGKVVLRVLIGEDGNAQGAEIKQSSGYDRLDKAALETVRKWRYVPGKRGGVAEAMWFDVPIQFVLE